jgi:hypothetical protein
MEHRLVEVQTAAFTGKKRNYSGFLLIIKKVIRFKGGYHGYTRGD